MFTSKAGEHEHNHRVDIDGQGDGKTIDTSYGVPHTHQVKNYKVLPVEGALDTHTHEVPYQMSKLGSDNRPHTNTIDPTSDDPPQVFEEPKAKSIKDKLMDTVKGKGKKAKTDEPEEAKPGVKITVEVK